VNEDPVTGSSHCTLAPYWGAKLGKETLSAYQLSSRGGALKLALAGDRVLIQGKAVTVIEGFFLLQQ
jgi:predicted PhzF superfamily epimerase YddE/YHI9